MRTPSGYMSEALLPKSICWVMTQNHSIISEKLMHESTKDILGEKVEIQNLSIGLDEKRLRRFGHVKGMDRTSIPRRKLKINCTGKKHFGRPRTRWSSKVQADNKNIGKIW
jgi:hypothetical protein